MTRGFLVVALILSIASSLTGGTSAEILFQRAMHKQTVEGDLETAIRLYREIAETHGANRAVAAKALVNMGLCYEKSGREEARKAYERVLRDYADQAASANEARTRLAGLKKPVKTGVELATRRLWHGPEVNNLGAPSGDGRYISATDWTTGNVVVRDLETGRIRAVTEKKEWFDSPAFAMFSVPSPDGSVIAYAWDNAGTYDLRLARLDGSAPRVLASGLVYLQPMSWTPDGKGVLTLLWKDGDREARAVIVNALDGEQRGIETLRGAPLRASFSPDGKYLAWDAQAPDGLRRDLVVRSLSTGAEWTLVQNPANDHSPIWTPDGRHVLFVTDRGGTPALWSIPVAEGRAAGEATVVKPDMGRSVPIGMTGNGTLFYAVEVGSKDIYEVSYDPVKGKIEGTPRRAVSRYVGSNDHGTWSPDGRSFCYISRRGSNLMGWGNQTAVLVIRDQEGAEREIQPELAHFSKPAWLPGGDILVTGRSRSGEGNGIYRIDSETGATGTVVESGAENPWWVTGLAVAPDGRTIYFTRQLDRYWALYRRDLATGEETVLHRTDFPVSIGVTVALSPDASLLATRMWNQETGSNAIRLVPAAGGEARDLVRAERPEAVATSSSLAFSRDGRSILFSRRRGMDDTESKELWRVAIDGSEEEPLGLAMKNVREISVSADGRRLLFGAGTTAAEIWALENLTTALTRTQNLAGDGR